MAITNEGVVIRTGVNEIPVYNRSATGVKVMKLDKDAKVAKMSFAAKDEEEIKENTEDVAENVAENTENVANAQPEAVVTEEAPKEE